VPWQPCAMARHHQKGEIISLGELWALPTPKGSSLPAGDNPHASTEPRLDSAFEGALSSESAPNAPTLKPGHVPAEAGVGRGSSGRAGFESLRCRLERSPPRCPKARPPLPELAAGESGARAARPWRGARSVRAATNHAGGSESSLSGLGRSLTRIKPDSDEA
jgi:hypothetical protein